jgi:GMP synthase PP-ATPase subunit
LLYTAVEQPDFLPEVLNLLDIRHEDFTDANEEMRDFFDFDTHTKPFNDKLQELAKKALDDKQYTKDARVVQILVNQLTLAKMTCIFSNDNVIEKNVHFIKQCKEAIASAKPFLEAHRVFNNDSFIQRLSGFFSPKTKMPQPLTIFEAELKHLAARTVPGQVVTA